MANNCGGCQLYQGPSQKCGAGKGPYSATSSASSSCYTPIPGQCLKKPHITGVCNANKYK